MALAPWNVLAGGKLRTDAEEQKRRESGEQGTTLYGPNWERNDQEKAAARALERVAEEVGAKSIGAGKRPFIVSSPILTMPLHVVAIAYVMHKAPFVFPVIGGRKVEHLLQTT